MDLRKIFERETISRASAMVYLLRLQSSDSNSSTPALIILLSLTLTRSDEFP